METFVDKLIQVYENLNEEVEVKFQGDIVARQLLQDLINKELVMLWSAQPDSSDEEGDDAPQATTRFYIKDHEGNYIWYESLDDDFRMFDIYSSATNELLLKKFFLSEIDFHFGVDFKDKIYLKEVKNDV